MKFKHENLDIHDAFSCRCRPVGDSRRYDDVFWKELMGGKEKKSKEQNLKELGF